MRRGRKEAIYPTGPQEGMGKNPVGRIVKRMILSLSSITIMMKIDKLICISKAFRTNLTVTSLVLMRLRFQVTQTLRRTIIIRLLIRILLKGSAK